MNTILEIGGTNTLFITIKLFKMPNWCSNYVTISGNKNEIKKIVDILDANPEGNLFESLVGIDPNISREDYDEGGWYNSNCDFWGCKWDVEIRRAYIDIDEEEINLSFDTPWSPAGGFCEQIVKEYNVSVHLLYDEPGLDFAGEINIDEYGNIDTKEYKYLEGIYHRDSDYFWSEVRSQLEYSIEENEPITAKYLAEWLHFITDKELADLIEEYQDNIVE